MSKKWGPAHECPQCGALVMWEVSGKGSFSRRLMEAGEARRHDCQAKHVSIDELDGFMVETPIVIPAGVIMLP